ncbi:MAG: hypothetical protein JWO92_1948 [Chitinophagaceae bacterium]|nr:hypothetical protein [Chitinophagaceae bacterium]MDB5222010.1 hypothetical protein [Chitinophagaceae bacterium]
MFKKSKIAAIILLVCFVTLVAIADRGGFGRRNKIHFNIITLNTLKNSVAFNLKSGLSYKGNTILNHQQVGNSIFTNSIVSYQKGNTIYILPYKQKILIQSYSPASGYKLIIRSK